MYRPKQELNIDFKATNIFYKNIEAKTKIVVNRGSARSSKSYSLLQLFLYRMLKHKDRKLLVLRKSMPFLKLSTLETWKNVVADAFATDFLKERKQEVSYEFEELNSKLRFCSMDDSKGMEKIKSSEFNDILLEEATEFSLQELLMMLTRTSAKRKEGDPRNQLFLSFNPISELHWIKKELIDSGKYTKDLTEITSTYKDNPFLDQDYIDNLESLATKDMNFYKVYALGEWGTLENVIYTNFKIIQDIPQDYKYYIYGLDFGYSSSETALIKIYFYDNEEKYGKNFICEEEVLYKKFLSNNQLIEELHKLIPNKNSPIFADSQEPDRIADIKKSGFLNIKKSKKDVLPGINKVKDYSIGIKETSVNLIKEKGSYAWKKDVHGNPTDQPVKHNDHLMDAERYAIFSHKKSDKRFYWL